MSGDEIMYTPDEWAPPAPEGPHDHKGHSEERCVRCGWVMGHQSLNCQNDDTPHVFPSQLAEVERLRAERDATRLIVNDLTVEIHWLRAAGDALCRYVTESGPGLHDDEAVIAYWEQARRGCE